MQPLFLGHLSKMELRDEPELDNQGFYSSFCHEKLQKLEHL